jgi:hypothetical protein
MLMSSGQQLACMHEMHSGSLLLPGTGVLAHGPPPDELDEALEATLVDALELEALALDVLDEVLGAPPTPPPPSPSEPPSPPSLP